MPIPVWSGASSEQSALCELIDRLADAWRPREPGAEQRIGRVRNQLAESGLWALGVAEDDGGGGADSATTALAIARVAAYWPAIGLGMAHLNAAGVALAGADILNAAADGGLAMAVLEAAEGLPDGGLVSWERVDVGDPGCDLVLLAAAEVRHVPAERAAFGSARKRTGLDGAASVPVTVLEGAAVEVRAGDAPSDAVRAALYSGVLAVAAGITGAVAHHAADYASGRLQFGAPLTALPTMREQLSTLRGQAVTLLATAMYPPHGMADAAAAMRQALDIAVDAAGAALGCLGGYGYLEEYPVAGLFRDAISLRAAADGVMLSRRAATDLAYR
jgi:alkylation response protein AidB-like acyl-CoA dehydrogenase